ncbi:hypothetical protein PIB30_101055 [Stylosanthes scabra]|uniref:Reverse transcriptase zinc-binding domain-containing protein n=1 Tax=Stylosanthes scabra TaxID=79078 RepID=A0ABU6QXN1_9FABA|nr:hypothetical protein [Stylosanthes scabra]
MSPGLMSVSRQSPMEKFSPPKLELLVWMVMLEKINTRDKLASCGVLPNSMAMCPMCDLHGEEATDDVFEDLLFLNFQMHQTLEKNMIVHDSFNVLRQWYDILHSR